MDLPALISQLHPLERKVLPVLKDKKFLAEIVLASKMQEVEVMRALQWLQNKELLFLNISKEMIVLLDKNGVKYREIGLPETRLLGVLSNDFQEMEQLALKGDLSREEVQACIGILKPKKALEIKNENGKLLLKSGQNKLKGKSAEEEFLKHDFPILYEKLDTAEKKVVEELKKRKEIISLGEEKNVMVELTPLGKKALMEKIDAPAINRLTGEMLQNGTWKNQQFRAYDVTTEVPSISGGRRHPYNEALNIIRNAFLEMGFQEMIGPWVETAFWGMDSMWIAQDHPMREAQDTFYLDMDGDLPDEKLVKKVKAAHENGFNTGSRGHTKNWDPSVARKLILRQHSTATSFRYLYDLKLNKNCKYFYIADNFRNEASDATHLPEFGQAEGFIVGDNLTLADLMGFIKEFYGMLGIHKIRFKPTFNPYTEPSMEAHYYNEELGKWYALINSGIFRPEALAPYGITKSVIAWGMGSSRIAGLLTGKNKLKELFGPEVDLDWIRKHQRVKTL